MKKKEILKYIDDNYQGDMDAFYKDYPDMESFKRGGKVPMYDDSMLERKKSGKPKRNQDKEALNAYLDKLGYNKEYTTIRTFGTKPEYINKRSASQSIETGDFINKEGEYVGKYEEKEKIRHTPRGTYTKSKYKVGPYRLPYWLNGYQSKEKTFTPSYAYGGYMYQMGGTTNPYMGYQDPTGTSNLTGGTDFYADTAGQTFDTSIGGEETADAIGAAAGSNPWSGAIYGAATAVQGVAKSGIEYEKDIYGNETNVPVANTSNTNLATMTRAPWEAASKEISEGNYGRAAVAGLIPVAGQVIAKQQIEEEQQEFAEGQELAKQEEVKFQENKAAFFSEQERQEKLGQQQLEESSYNISFSEYGGYVNPVAKVESPEYVGNRKVYGQTHKGPNQGVDVGFASNGLPMAGHGGTLGAPIGNNEGIDNNFVWSDSVFLDEDEYKQFLT